MKKRFIKLMSVILASALVLPVFALTACTDKRQLNSVEQSIVGTWRGSDLSNGGTRFVFNSDGSFEYYSPVLEPVNPDFPHGTHKYKVKKTATGNFAQQGEDIETVDYERGHYYIINANGNSYALFDIESDKLYLIVNSVISDFYYSRSTN